MDLWVVAAAAAAGYLGKYWQKVSSDSDSLSNFSSGDPKYRRPKKSEGKASDSYQLDEALPNEIISSSEGRLGVYSKRDVFSLSSTLPGFFNNEDRNGISVKSSHDYVRNRRSIRSKHPYQRVVKPLNSIESCLMAQLYKEHIKMDEYVLNSLPFQATPTTMRPLLVTDGRKVISKVSGDSFNCKLPNEAYAYVEKNGFAFGVSPPLPKIKHFDPLKKINAKTGMACEGKSSSSNQMVSGTHFHSADTHGGMVLFSLGISIGMISSVLANKKEMERLKELIKQRENLVQDLQEEIEMKDALTVKELANENYESRGNSYFSDREPNPSPPKENMANSTYYTESYDGKAEEISDSMSKIEAELEAELERLGLNINTSELKRRTSENVQIEPDFVADEMEGQAVASNQDRDGTSTPHSGNYTVSPRELSLRLHEVIESRLVQRIEELETALLNSRIKVQTIESECKSPMMKLCDEKTYDLVLTPEEFNSISQPLVMHLSGEALDAYGEAYEELMKINESDEEGEIYENIHQDESIRCERGMPWSLDDFENGLSSHCSYSEETSEELFPIRLRSMQDESAMVWELFEIGSSEEDASSSNCDEEKQLIKQIVEKTKKGSSVVLNAQKVLFSMDEKL